MRREKWRFISSMQDAGYCEELSTNWADRIDRNTINYSPMMLTPTIEHLRWNVFFIL